MELNVLMWCDAIISHVARLSVYLSELNLCLHTNVDTTQKKTIWKKSLERNYSNGFDNSAQ